MSAFDTRIHIDDRMTPILAKLKAAGGDLSEPMAEIAIEVLTHTQDRFRQQFDPEGVPWEPSKRVLEEGGDTLYLEGWLFRALDEDHGADYAQVGVSQTGPAAAYAKPHQEGATIRPREGNGKKALNTPFGPRASVTIPARPYLGIEARDITAVDAIILAHLAKATASGGVAQS